MPVLICIVAHGTECDIVAVVSGTHRRDPNVLRVYGECKIRGTGVH